MGFLGGTVSFAARACLSVAISEMIIPINRTNQNNELTICPADTPSNLSTTSQHTTYERVERYNWTEKQQGWILSSFYVGHLIGHLPAGMLCEKFGGKWVLSVSVFLTSICNAAIPHVLKYGGFDK